MPAQLMRMSQRPKRCSTWLASAAPRVRGLDIGDDDVHAVFREPPRKGLPEAVRRTGNDRNLIAMPLAHSLPHLRAKPFYQMLRPRALALVPGNANLTG